MAWTDTAAAPNANPTLVNDLNLELTAPSGTCYRGNQYSGGHSIPNPVDWDDRNVEECIRVDDPEIGMWYLAVHGLNIPFGPQPFAYAITGDAVRAVHVEEGSAPVIEKPWINFVNSIVNNRIHLEITLHSTMQVTAELIDVCGRVVRMIIDERLPAGTHDFECSLDLACGVYFLRYQAGDHIEKQKVIKIR